VSLPFTLHSLAELDVLGAWEWYEQQQPGLGDHFVAAVGVAIVRACHWPDAGTPAIHDDKGDVLDRRVATDGFPYAVGYRVADGHGRVPPAPPPRLRSRPNSLRRSHPPAPSA
jgi:hypothetical protein